MATQANRLIGEEAMQLDRRAGVRLRTVYRSGKISSAANAGLCWILNLSDGGAMVETGIALSIGEQASIELADGIRIDGKLVWQEAERAGIIFSPPINSLALLKQLADARRKGRLRPVRLQVNKLVEVGSELGPSILRLHDISQRGLRLRHIGNLSVGMPITVRLTHSLVVKGIVSWKQDSEAGVELDGMIAVSELMSAAIFEAEA